MNRELLLRRGAWLGIALLVALLWAPVLQAPFVYDDKIEVIGNRTIRMIEEWRAIAGYNISRPLLIFSYALNFDAWGLEPLGYHITTVAIHILGAGAALAFGEALGRWMGVEQPLQRTALAVCLWSVHPMVTEAVTYTTGRSESLCALWVLTSLWAWCEAGLASKEGRASLGWRCLAWLGFALAISTKEVAAALPAALLAVELLAGPPWREGGWRRYLPFAPFALLIPLAAWARLQHAGELIPVEVPRPLSTQATTSAWVWLRYLQLWLVPVGQTIFHDQQDVGLASLRGALAWAGLGGLVAAGLWLRRRAPALAVGMALAGLFLLPSTSIVMLKEHLAEHRAYQTGLYLALGLALAWPAARLRQGLWIGLALLPALMGATWLRHGAWKSEVDLWLEATERNPDSAEAWYGLGDAHRFALQKEAAIAAFEHAVALDPSALDSWNNLGIARAELGDRPGAMEAWKQALRQRPSYCKAHTNIGSLAYREQDWTAAIAALNSALAYCPDNVVAHFLLGNIYYGPQRDPRKAQLHYEAVVQLDRGFSQIALVKERLLQLTW